MKTSSRTYNRILRIISSTIVAILIFLLDTAYNSCTAVVTEEASIGIIRIAKRSIYTRFAVDLSIKASLTLSLLSKQNHLIILAPRIAWHTFHIATNKLIRAYYYNRTMTYIKLILKEPITISTAFLLPPNGRSVIWRLVIDLADNTTCAYTSNNIVQTKGTVNSKRYTYKPSLLEIRQSKSSLLTSTHTFQTQFVLQHSLRALIPTAQINRKINTAKHTIMLDPGHGGFDPGATGTSGVFEKNIALSLATELRTKLLATGRYHVVLTREHDTFVALRARVESAHVHKAKLFISLHANSISNPRIHGISVYTVSKASNIIEKETRSSLVNKVDLMRKSRNTANTPVDLVQRENISHSIQLAGILIHEFRKKVPLLSQPHRSSNFVVLKESNIPAILLEIGYLSNSREEQLLRQSSYREKIIISLVRAIDLYFKKH